MTFEQVILREVADQLGFLPQIPVTAKEIREEITRLRSELDKCGKENCMGHRIDGMANWVREERLIEAKAELGKAQEEIKRARAEIEELRK